MKTDEKTVSEIYDAVVVGGGPAGLAAAIYLARARFSVAVIEKENVGGQIAITDEVVNYPGILRTTGKALMETMRRQAENFGAEIVSADALSLDFSAPVKTVKTTRGDVRALGAVVAAGARPRSVGFRGESEFRGRGVAYCATCDGEFFAGKELLVIGGGLAACEESLFLTRYASKITMLVRRDAFSCPQSVVEKIFAEPKISVRFETELQELRGSAAPESAVLRNARTGATEEFRPTDGGSFGVFVFAGYSPASELLAGKIALDADGYAVADAEGKTDVRGVYVAGDLRRKRLRQVVTAVSDGATAATALEKEIPEIRADAGGRTKPCGRAKNDATNSSPAASAAETPDANGSENSRAAGDAFFDDAAREQLRAVFSKFEKNIVLAIEGGNDSVSDELRRFVGEIAALSAKMSLRDGAPAGADPASARISGKRARSTASAETFAFSIAMRCAAATVAGQSVHESETRI